MDALPWPDLPTTHGTAADVPAQLRRLARAPTSREASGALRELSALLIEPGVSPATAAAVPFLVALAADERVTCRRELLDLVLCALWAGAGTVPDPRRAVHAAVLGTRAVVDRLTADPLPAVAAAARHLGTAIDTHACALCPPTPRGR
ncbi:hypothetical protein [Yinghuangia seranimata]|uniref:hypothetical protein n=1 Tax=Yinghuangia seranimata TaxID=408067 RepID=UPI00248D3951|nr:hypothetical protein [Yinghuangia seranimata]MDI2129717.1 hypothetical protein [Yinghuangia seranimata]